MSSRYVAAALAAMMLMSTAAFAADPPPPPPSPSTSTTAPADKETAKAKAIVKASPTLAKTPGAAAAAERKIVPTQSITPDTTTQTVTQQTPVDTTQAAQTFRGTAASVHSEDQCTIFNLNVSRFIQPDQTTTTFLNYWVQRFCTGGAAGSGNSSGSLEIPDVAFSGDPRKDNVVTLKIDTLPAEMIQGPPLVIDLTWTKDDSSVSQGANRQSTKSKLLDGTFVVTAFHSTFNLTSAALTGTVKTDTDIPVTNADASISWDDFSSR